MLSWGVKSSATGMQLRVLNLSNYNKDGSPEAPDLTLVLLEEKRHEGHKGGVNGIYLACHHICLSDFLFVHIVTPPPLCSPP
jgi:hypothetical protein